MSDLQGAFSFKQLTEEFTIPQVQIMLKDKPHMEYDDIDSEDNSSKKIDSAMDLVGSMSR